MAKMFSAYPTVFLRETPGGSKSQQLIWGDFVQTLGERDGEWQKVKARGTTGWLRDRDLQTEQLLEVCFVDIGQGDGCLLVTPDDRFLLIDAGEAENMRSFLRWRFNLRKNPERQVRFAAAVVTHPDSDHYRGFQTIFEDPQFAFDTVYHNGIVERQGSGATVLGPRADVGEVDCLVDLKPDAASASALVHDAAAVASKWYPQLLRTALDGGRVTDLRMLSERDGHMPGFAAGDLRLEVLGPVPETQPAPDGRPALRWLGDAGKTKNGHSVVLRLVYRDLKLLLGGDLNSASEHHLLRQATGLDPEDPNQHAAIVAAARPRFGADVAKACHHGSADFTALFLDVVHPAATVISSGDNEPHCHPRPDTLGAIGKASRGERPLIFSTELARSSSESIRDAFALRAEIRELSDKIAAALDDATKTTLRAKLDAKLAKIERSVAVFGMITLRSDGHRVLMAQKLEEPRSSTHESFDVHCLEPGPDGVLRYVPERA